MKNGNGEKLHNMKNYDIKTTHTLMYSEKCYVTEGKCNERLQNVKSSPASKIVFIFLTFLRISCVRVHVPSRGGNAIEGFKLAGELEEAPGAAESCLPWQDCQQKGTHLAPQGPSPTSSIRSPRGSQATVHLPAAITDCTSLSRIAKQNVLCDGCKESSTKNRSWELARSAPLTASLCGQYGLNTRAWQPTRDRQS